MFDFEIGTIKAFQKVFPNSKVKGCLFYFSQNLMRKLCKISLKADSIDNKEFQHWIKRIFPLAITSIDIPARNSLP